MAEQTKVTVSVDVVSADPNRGPTDLILEARSIWLEVGNIAFYLFRSDEGVLLEAYPLGQEGSLDLMLAKAEISFAQAESLIQTAEKENE
jgi:hypothetical protein